ncbi:hypothetical protein HPULCUR_004491 [Helicostylum pulchrum]|uniref:Uncharacterized protein n=1 Tax=Helicostylum pulchrum TaxID=562976 RepID=A0ABP9XWD3_9FUNG
MGLQSTSTITPLRDMLRIPLRSVQYPLDGLGSPQDFQATALRYRRYDVPLVIYMDIFLYENVTETAAILRNIAEWEHEIQERQAINLPGQGQNVTFYEVYEQIRPLLRKRNLQEVLETQDQGVNENTRRIAALRTRIRHAFDRYRDRPYVLHAVV